MKLKGLNLLEMNDEWEKRVKDKKNQWKKDEKVFKNFQSETFSNCQLKSQNSEERKKNI